MTITASAVLVDNGYGTLGGALSTSDTTLTFTTGHGARFPAVASGQVLMCCILNSNNVLEEVAVTLHTAGADTATMVRGQNSTTAKAWNAGDRIEARVSSEVLKRQQSEAMKEVVLSTADSGATYTGSISPTAYGLVSGLVYALTAATSNSGTAPTINLSSLGAVTVKLDGGSALTAGQMPKHGLYKYDGTNFLLMNAAQVGAIGFVFDGGGSALTTGVKGDLLIPFACTINSATLEADQSGSIVIDIWKKAYAVSSPPTVANTITASAKPTLSTAQSSQDATLTGWTTSISANDMVRFNIDSITTCTRVTLTLKVTRT